MTDSATCVGGIIDVVAFDAKRAVIAPTVAGDALATAVAGTAAIVTEESITVAGLAAGRGSFSDMGIAIADTIEAISVWRADATVGEAGDVCAGCGFAETTGSETASFGVDETTAGLVSTRVASKSATDTFGVD